MKTFNFNNYKRINDRKGRNCAYQVAKTCKSLNKRLGKQTGVYESQQRTLRKMLGF